MQPTTPTELDCNLGKPTPPNTEAAHRANFEDNFHALICKPFQDAYDNKNVDLYVKIAQDFAETLIGSAIEQAIEKGITGQTIKFFDRVFITVSKGHIMYNKIALVTYCNITLSFQDNNAKHYYLKLSKIVIGNNYSGIVEQIIRRNVQAPENFMLELDLAQSQLSIVPTLKKTEVYKFFFELLYPK